MHRSGASVLDCTDRVRLTRQLLSWVVLALMLSGAAVFSQSGGFTGIPASYGNKPEMGFSTWHAVCIMPWRKSLQLGWFRPI
jgi:hypothetical protein